MANYKSFTFTHPTARATTVNARTSDEAWTKLQRTHEYHSSDRKGWKRKVSESAGDRVEKVVTALLEGRDNYEVYKDKDGVELDFSDDCYNVWIKIEAERRHRPGDTGKLETVKAAAKAVGITQEPVVSPYEGSNTRGPFTPTANMVEIRYAGLHHDHAEQLEQELAKAGVTDVFVESDLDND